jgi:hypothetical protein
MILNKTWSEMRFLDVISRKRWTAVCAVVLAMGASLMAQSTPRANRITQELISGPVVAVAGTVHPLTQRATDLGAVNSGMQMDSMTLNIALSPDQQAELDALTEAQQDPKSPLYHQWLTQEEFGARFGLTDADLSKVTGWLTTQGLTVKKVASSRNAITFSGKAWQVESAFHTQLHQYETGGEKHFANATELRVPAGIGSVMLNVRGLDSFRWKPRFQSIVRPQFTNSTTQHFLSPGDWATIYNVTAIYAGSCAGSACDGTGMHVGVVGQTYVPQADIDHFRSAAGLSATKLTPVCIDTTVANCTGTAAISTTGDLGEADLDIEWAGGIAKNATVDYVYAPYSDTLLSTNSLNVLDALAYAVQTYKVAATGKVLPVISMSYGDCEKNLNTSYANFVTSVGQQAQAQGQTLVVSSGDSGAAGCDTQGVPASDPARLGISAGVPVDSPYYTGVGGTTLSGDVSNPAPYWNQTAGQVNSALAYIPETVWNDTSSTNGLLASGGGVSTWFPLPSWQTAPLGYAGPLMRFEPDVAFAGSPNHDGYLICSQDDNSTTYGNSCTTGFGSSKGYLNLAGGTSAGTPSFAGMLTLLVQKYGALGNINPKLYSLAISNPAVFHDTTGGNNIVPCVTGTTGCVGGSMGYPATTGYDLATGLGSIDGGALYAALGSGLTTTTTTITATPASVSIGGTTSLTATVTPTTATGTVTFTKGATTLGSPVTLASGTATLSGEVVSVANGFSAGTDAITARYSGDATFAASGSSTDLTVIGLATTTSVTATPSSALFGATTNLVATVAPSTATGTVTFKVGSTTVGSASVSGGTATLSNAAISAANGFSAGSNTITALYNGDATYQTSSGTTPVTVTGFSTTTTLSANPSAVGLGGATTLTATVTSGTAGNITGTVTFTMGSTTLGTGAASNGVATLPITVSAPTFSMGSDTITASYGGGSGYMPSSGSLALTVGAAPTYTLTPSATSVTGSSSVTLTLNSTNYAGTVSFMTSVSSTNGTATNVTASAPSVTLTSGGTGISTLTVTANSSAANRSPQTPWKSGGGVVFCAVLLGAPFTLRRKRAVMVLLTAMAISLAGFLISCGGSTKAARIYTVTVIPTGSSTVTNPSAVSIVVTVP